MESWLCSLKNTRKGLEFNFVWIFAILVGAIILFLAIYSASKIIKGGSFEQDTLTAKQIVTTLENAETGLAAGIKQEAIRLKDETKLFNVCSESESFGRQRISVSSRILNTWQDESARISVANKYIFSDSVEQGKTFYYFSKPWMMPFKVADLIFLSSKKYIY